MKTDTRFEPFMTLKRPNLPYLSKHSDGSEQFNSYSSDVFNSALSREVDLLMLIAITINYGGGRFEPALLIIITSLFTVSYYRTKVSYTVYVVCVYLLGTILLYSITTTHVNFEEMET